MLSPRDCCVMHWRRQNLTTALGSKQSRKAYPLCRFHLVCLCSRYLSITSCFYNKANVAFVGGRVPDQTHTAFLCYGQTWGEGRERAPKGSDILSPALGLPG